MATGAKFSFESIRLGVLDPYPLGFQADGNPATADLTLEGSLFGAQSYSYRLSLEADVAYRFAAGDGADGFAESVVLVDPISGDLKWGNEIALTTLGLSPLSAQQVLQNAVLAATPGEAVLVVTDQAGLRSLAGLDAQSDPPVGSDDPAAGGRAFALTVQADPVAIADDAIFRFVKPDTGMYFYTASRPEAETIRTSFPEFRYEGPAFAGDAEPRADWVPVYRFANQVSGGYFYTANALEADAIVASQPNLRPEGVAFWTPPAASAGTIPVFRLVNLDTGGYLFTASRVEKIFALLQGNWRDEGIAFQSIAEVSAADTADTLASQQPELAVNAPAADPLVGADPTALSMAFDVPGYIGIADDALQGWV